MNTRKLATKAVLWLMHKTRGNSWVDFWAWEMTPMPVGPPSWKQIRVGFAIAIGLDFIARSYKRKMDRAEADVMLSLGYHSDNPCKYLQLEELGS
jgi:hypothetical protein